MPQNENQMNINVTTDLKNLKVFMNAINDLSDRLNMLRLQVSNLNNQFTNFDTGLRRLFGVNTDTEENLNNEIQETTKSFKSGSKEVANFFDSMNSKGRSSLTVLNNLRRRLYDIHGITRTLITVFAGRQAWNWLIGTNEQIETLQKSLEVTLKSLDEAENAIYRMRSYAAITPFDEIEVFRSGEILAANRMEIMRWLEVAGDLAAAKATQGTQLEDVVNVLTRINAGDFGRAMIRLRQLGISMRDLTAEGLKFSRNSTYLGTADEFLNALERIITRRYGGMTEVLSRTATGLKSNIQDVLQQMGVEFGSELFKDWKSFLRRFEQEIQDFRNSIKFNELVNEFNEAVNRVKESIQPIIDLVVWFVNFLINNLPLIGSLVSSIVKAFTIRTILNVITSIVNSILSIRSNWNRINQEINTQNNLLKQQNVQLNNQRIQLAKILALRQLGTKEATKQQIADATSASLLTVSKTDTRNAFTQAAKSATGATQKAMSAAGAVSLVKKGVSFVSKLAGWVSLIFIAFDLIRGIVESFNSEVESNFSVDDYDRIIGERNDEIKAIETLNESRLYAIERLNTYNQMLKQSEEGTESYIMIQNELNSAKQDLIRINEQMISLSPDLMDILVDEEGRLKDLTGAYDENTQAIRNNLNMKRLAISELYRQQLTQATLEAENAQAQIEEIQQQIEKVQSGTYDYLKNPWKRVGANILSWASRLLGVGYLPGLNERIKDIDEISKIYAKGEKGLEIWLNNQKLEIMELQKIIENSQSIQQLEVDARRKGYVVRETDEYGVFTGYYLTPTGQRTQNIEEAAIDVQSLLADQERLSNLSRELEINVDSLSQNIIYLLENASQTAEEIEKSKKVLALQELIKSGGEETAEYIEFEKQKNQAIADYYDSVLNDLKQMAEINKREKQKRAEMLKEVPEVIEMLESGTGLDEVISYVESLQKGFLTEVVTAYQTALEVEEKIQNARNEINIKKAEALIEKIRLGRDQAKSLLDQFLDSWDPRIRVAELTRDIALQRAELSGYSEESSRYRYLNEKYNYQIRNLLLQQINELRQLIPKLDEESKINAQIQLLELQKEANSLLLKIKENTSFLLGEFNKPSYLKALSYYDFKTREPETKSISIANAEFAFNIEAVQNIEDVNNMMELIRETIVRDIARGRTTN